MCYTLNSWIEDLENSFFGVTNRQGVFLFCYFWNFRQTNAVCWAEKYPETKKNDTLITLINQSQEIRPQGLDLGRSTSIRGRTSAQIKTLRPYFSIFSITVVRICLRKQQLKFFTNMLSTPSIEPVNIWFDSASPCVRVSLTMIINCSIHSDRECSTVGKCPAIERYYLLCLKYF